MMLPYFDSYRNTGMFPAKSDCVISTSDEIIEGIDYNFIEINDCPNLTTIRDIKFNYLRITNCPKTKNISGFFKAPEDEIAFEFYSTSFDSCIFYKFGTEDSSPEDLSTDIEKVQFEDIPHTKHTIGELPTLWNPNAKPTPETEIGHSGCGHMEVIKSDIESLYKVGGTSFTVENCPKLKAIDDCNGNMVSIVNCASLKWIRNTSESTYVDDCPMLEHAHKIDGEYAKFTNCAKLLTIQMKDTVEKSKRRDKLISYGSRLKIIKCPSLKIVCFKQKIYDSDDWDSSSDSE